MSSAPPPKFFRVRVVLGAGGPVALHSHHSAALYGLIAAAQGRGSGAEPAVPDGLMLDAPEQCRVRVLRGEPYAFGFTLLDADPEAASGRVRTLLDGLRGVGESAGPNRPAWGGNFRVEGVEDLVAGRAWDERGALVPVADAHLDAEAGRIAGLDRVTLRFSSPFRAERPRSRRRPGHGFFDRDEFCPRGFASRLWNRLALLGLCEGAGPPADSIRVAENRLCWLDFSYGFASARQRLGGAVGRLDLEGVPAGWARPLALGQYARAGLNTRFGFGAYRVEPLGPDPFPCRRSLTLVDLALRGPALDKAAEGADLPAGRLRHLADSVGSGGYRPGPSAVVAMAGPGGRSRRLAIPGAEDRALQRAVLSVLGPGLDPFLEDASLAFRRGLGRHGAAGALADAWSEGYRWAVRADVHRFFDSIDHAALRERLDAYLADESAVDLLMAWARAGSPEPGVGLPIGSPLSPLLANLFLDGFDERIAAEGGRLVRYADDFLILTRDRAEAERLLEVARLAAAEVELTLNAEKTSVIAPGESFEFLGFRFERRDRWEARPGGGVAPVEEIGWSDARPVSLGPIAIRLPGEVEAAGDDGAVLVAGPGRYEVTLDGSRVVCGDGEAAPWREVDRIDAAILIGEPSLGARALRAMAGRGAAVFVTDEGLRDPVALAADPAAESVEAVLGQCRAEGDEGRRLALARVLVAAKLGNFAALADAAPGRADDRATGRALRELAGRCADAPSFEVLLGLEGAGARAWFAALPGRLPGDPRWRFGRRVAPAADDPVNVLLNIGQTHLYRWAQLAARAAGLVPSIGLFHRPRPGHSALASDLQEPFRHLVDRAVIELAARLDPADFRRTPGGRFALTLLPRASQQVAAAFARAFRRGVVAAADAEPRSYRGHLFAQARSLRRALIDPAAPWAVFRQPT